MLDATFSSVSKPDAVSDEDRARCTEHMQKTKEMLRSVAEMDVRADRAGLLGLLELMRRARVHGFPVGKLTPFFFDCPRVIHYHMLFRFNRTL